jgi:hypothetical protein
MRTRLNAYILALHAVALALVLQCSAASAQLGTTGVGGGGFGGGLPGPRLLAMWERLPSVRILVRQKHGQHFR